MKGNSAFSLQNIGDVYLLVPLREEAFQKERIIPTNETGALLWRTLQEECTEEALAEAILQEYETEQEVALADVRNFLQALEEGGALIR